MASRKVVPMKKRFRPNLALFIFFLILIYLGVITWGYVNKKHVSIYEVNTTNISDDSPMYGMILRSEEVVQAKEDGYINFYHAEGSRIGAGDIVYTLDQNGEVSEMLNQLQDSGKNQESVTAMREVTASFQNTFSLSSYSMLENFKYDVNNILFEKTNGNLYSNLSNALKASGKSKTFTRYKSNKNGVISYSVDGYEKYKKTDITPALLDEYGKSTRQQLQTTEKIRSGNPVYKLVTDNTWTLVVKLDQEYYEKLQEADTVRITINKDNISLNASVELWDQGEIHFASLTTSRFMERYINDRFLQIELNLKKASGLKIPNSSIAKEDYYVLPANVITKGEKGNGVIKQIVDKEGKISQQFASLGNYFIRNEKYYVDDTVVTGGDKLMIHDTGQQFTVSDKESVSGVCCVNQGFSQFRPIEILYQNKEYTIVSDSTSGGLTAYDHIVVDPSSLGDTDFIE